MLVSGNLPVTVLVFVGIGAANQGFQNASQNMTLEFGIPSRLTGADRDRQHHVGTRRYDRTVAGRRSRRARRLSGGIHGVRFCSWSWAAPWSRVMFPNRARQGDFV
jgi:hypothetical protein